MPALRFGDLLKENEKKNQESVPEHVSSLVKELDSKSGLEERIGVKLVSRKKIRFHENNDFSQDNIESLADSILKYGIQNIPSGHYKEEDDVYIVENGERRTRALDLLIDTYQDCADKDSENYRLYEANVAKYTKGYPFHIVQKFEMDRESTRVDEIDSELRLIDANTESRDNEEERRVHILKKIELLNEKNRLLGKDEIKNTPNVVKEIASTEDISKRQAYKYHAASSLIPELKDLFIENEITLNDSEFYSKLTEEEQKQIVELIKRGNSGGAQELYTVQQELTRVQEEKEQAVNEYEQKIVRLQGEKKSAEESLRIMQKTTQDSITDSINSVKKQLEDEYKKLNEQFTEEQQKKVEDLEGELQSIALAKETLQESFKKEQRDNEAKEHEIEKLKLRVTELQNPVDNPVDDDALLNKVREEMTYKISYESLSEGIKAFRKIALNHPLENEVIKSDIDSLISALTGVKKNLAK